MFAPEVRAGGLKTLLVVLFALAILLIWVFGSGWLTVVVGAVLILFVLTIMYYAFIRFDKWAKGGRKVQPGGGGEN